MSVLNQIKKTFKIGQIKEYYETYWVFDIHDTILKANYDLNRAPTEEDFFPFAKETLQILSKLDNIVMIMWTSSYPREIKEIQKLFKEHDIKFNYIGDNPEISSNKGNFGYYEDKFYFNVMFEDKAGFDIAEWENIYAYLLRWKERGEKPDPKWSTKY